MHAGLVLPGRAADLLMPFGGHSLACVVRASNSTPLMNFRGTSLIEPDQAVHQTRH